MEGFSRVDKENKLKPKLDVYKGNKKTLVSNYIVKNGERVGIISAAPYVVESKKGGCFFLVINKNNETFTLTEDEIDVTPFREKELNVKETIEYILNLSSYSFKYKNEIPNFVDVINHYPIPVTLLNKKNEEEFAIDLEEDEETFAIDD